MGDKALPSQVQSLGAMALAVNKWITWGGAATVLGTSARQQSFIGRPRSLGHQWHKT